MGGGVGEAPWVVAFPLHRAVLEIITSPFGFTDRLEKCCHVRIGKVGRVLLQAGFPVESNTYNLGLVILCGRRRSGGSIMQGLTRR